MELGHVGAFSICGFVATHGGRGMCWGPGTGVGPGASFLLYPPRPETRPTEVRRLRDPSAGEDGREHLGAHHLRLPHHRLHDPLLVRGFDHEVRGKGCRRHGYFKQPANGAIRNSCFFLKI